MQFIDLKTQYERIAEDVKERVIHVLESQRYIMGPEVSELEEKLAAFAGVKHAFTCSSGTDALVIPLMAFELDKRDAVFVPSFTFFASGESVALAGGTPVFVDTYRDTYNISIEDLERAICKIREEGELTPRGIIAVDLFGQPADYDRLEKIAADNDMFLLEDAAQGFGSEYKGRRAGSFGTVAATSFFPAKPLGCYGDGGAMFTDDDELAELIKSIRVHGQGTSKYDNVRLGINGRMDTIQAAIVLAKLEVFEDEIETRNVVASWYTDRLQGILKTPVVADGCLSVWAQYTLEAETEEQKATVQQALQDQGVPTANYYPIPMHLSTAFSYLGYKNGDLPVCEAQASRVFSLPMHPYLEEKDIDMICDIVKEALA